METWCKFNCCFCLVSMNSIEKLKLAVVFRQLNTLLCLLTYLLGSVERMAASSESKKLVFKENCSKFKRLHKVRGKDITCIVLTSHFKTDFYCGL